MYKYYFEQTYTQGECQAAMVLISEFFGDQNQIFIDRLSPHVQDQSAMAIYCQFVRSCFERPDEVKNSF